MHPFAKPVAQTLSKASSLLLVTLLLGTTTGCVRASGGEPRNFVKTNELYENKDYRFQIRNDYRLVTSSDETQSLVIPWPQGSTLTLNLLGSSEGMRRQLNLHVGEVEKPLDAAATADLVAAILENREAATRTEMAKPTSGQIVTTRVSREVKPYPIEGLPGAQLHRLTFFHTVDEGMVGKEREEAGAILDVMIGVRDKRVFYFDLLLSGTDLPGYVLTPEDARVMGYDYEIERRDYRLKSLKVLD